VKEPLWLTLEQVLAIHNVQILRFGGAARLRDEGLSSSAIARPVHAWHHGVADYAALGAGYAYGIVKTHSSTAIREPVS
jgi:death-on-curing protein